MQRPQGSSNITNHNFITYSTPHKSSPTPNAPTHASSMCGREILLHPRPLLLPRPFLGEVLVACCRAGDVTIPTQTCVSDAHQETSACVVRTARIHRVSPKTLSRPRSLSASMGCTQRTPKALQYRF